MHANAPARGFRALCGRNMLFVQIKEKSDISIVHIHGHLYCARTEKYHASIGVDAWEMFDCTGKKSPSAPSPVCARRSTVITLLVRQEKGVSYSEIVSATCVSVASVSGSTRYRK